MPVGVLGSRVPIVLGWGIWLITAIASGSNLQELQCLGLSVRAITACMYGASVHFPCW